MHRPEVGIGLCQAPIHRSNVTCEMRHAKCNMLHAMWSRTHEEKRRTPSELCLCLTYFSLACLSALADSASLPVSVSVSFCTPHNTPAPAHLPPLPFQFPPAARAHPDALRAHSAPVCCRWGLVFLGSRPGFECLFRVGLRLQTLRVPGAMQSLAGDCDPGTDK